MTSASHLVFATGIIITGLVAVWVDSANEQEVKKALTLATERAAYAVTKRVELYQYGLRGARGVVLAKGESGLNRRAFQAYSQVRDLDLEFPGARGFGFIRRVSPEAETDFLSSARADDMPNFEIRQLTPHDGERFVIQYIEPREGNAAAVGLDIASEENRRAAAVAAMVSGEVRITAPITLVQATGYPLQSFLILLPIYRDGITPDNVEERMAEGIGWSYAPLLTDEIMRSLPLDREGLSLHLSDTTVPDQPVEFFHGGGASDEEPSELRHAVSRPVYGRQWQVELQAEPAFLAGIYQFPPILVIFLGVLSSTLLAMLARVAMVSRQSHREVLELNDSLEHQVDTRTRELREINILLSNVLESASEVSIIATDTEGVVRVFNRGAERLLGYSADEIVGLQTPAYFHLPEEVEARGIELSREYGQTIQGFRVFVHKPEIEVAESREWKYVRKDGDQITVTLMVTAMRDTSGCLVGYLGIALDLTGEVKLRREALAARDQVLLATEVADLGIWSWTPAHNRLEWNSRMFELYGHPLSSNEPTYDQWLSLVHPDDVAILEACLKETMIGTSNSSAVFRVVRPDSKVLYTQLGAHAERCKDGLPLRITGINRDITAQRDLEAWLRHAKEQADEASAAKSSFLANISHEIRTPMNAVLGMLQLVKSAGLNSRQLDYVVNAQGAAESLLSLLSDVLDYSKIEAGKLVPDAHDFELELLLRDLAVILTGIQGDRNLEVMFDVDTALPGRLQGDKLRIQQILTNLTGNALKFTSEGQVIVSVRQLQRTTDKVTLRFAVSDTGIGISEKHLQQIFEGFTQAEASTSRRFGGSGLGLTICKRLVELMGGDLKVESRLGQGSRFWFDLELGVADEATLIPESGTDLDDLRVLIVDDNPVARAVLEQTVVNLGCRVDTVASGPEALGKVQIESYDVVMMDWLMPEMDGFETAQRMRDCGAVKIPVIIMVTAHGRELIGGRYPDVSSSIREYLSKLVTPQQLVSSLKNACWGSSVEKAPSPRQSFNRLQGLRLLIVEDNSLNRQVCRGLLLAEGAEINMVASGQQAIETVLNSHLSFDAVLMDVQMPEVDGLEATRRIRQHASHRELPIIAITANAAQVDRDDCLAAGMNDHVSKPIDIEALVAVVQRWCGRAHAVEQLLVEESYTENAEAILKRFGGNLGLLHTMLVTFPEQAEEFLARLRFCIQDGDVTGIVKVLHTLKGSSGTIGAQRLSVRCGELEWSFKEVPENALADSGWLADLRALLEQDCDRLRTMFPQDAGQNPVVENRCHVKSWSSGLEQLLKQLEQGSLAALDTVKTLSFMVPEPLVKPFDTLRQAVESLDYRRSRELLKEVLITMRRA